MRLSEIAGIGELFEGKPPGIVFNGVQCDSRRIRPGDIFVAIKGVKEDGAGYVEAALAKGAAAVVAETPLREGVKPAIVVKDARRALALLAAAVNGWPSHQMKVYGITGTNGKTTTAWLLREMLRAGGAATGLLTTVQVEYAGREIPATHTTPDACELQSLLAQMLGSGCESAVMEVSSHALEQQRVAAVRFAGAGFTNLSQDHLDYHGTMEAYFQAKSLMFTRLAQDTPGVSAVCCIEEGQGYGRRMAEIVAGLPLKLTTCGLAADAHIRAEEIALTTDGGRFVMVLPGGQRLSLHVRMAGRYNVANMLCAATMALEAGVPLEAIITVLESAEPRWGRLERVPAKTPATVFVDYAHTDDALTNVLGTLREMTSGRLIVVFGCGGNRDRSKRPKMGAACARLADRLIVTSDNPRREDPLEIIREIMAGVPEGTDCVIEPDRRAAIRRALINVAGGDVVLVAGKGHEPFQELADRTVPFDDRRVVIAEAEALRD
ncbi:MAG: UDP-N-acetylmuramoyl-L-alanyl-D-glutamate--2,6-diaminopimelate ligase [Kiritimatiellae bacterium]|nr:UDP-N-acetylmuramoyl-L-alanyl-D-glutamate--2,6-diaminopimelate ligase [Kiritimatiellia bacterium]